MQKQLDWKQVEFHYEFEQVVTQGQRTSRFTARSSLVESITTYLNAYYCYYYPYYSSIYSLLLNPYTPQIGGGGWVVGLVPIPADYYYYQ